MSTTDPKRLSDYGDRLDGVVKAALDAERHGDVDAARLAAIEAKLAARLAPAPPPPPSSSRPILWVGAAAVAFGVAMFALSRPAAPPPPAPPVAVTSAPAPAPLPPPEPVALPTISPSDLPSVREPLTPSARTIVSAPAPAAAPPLEQEEIALIARAQAALAADPGASLALCREHAQRFTSGHFAQEREAVAIEALAELHRNQEATERFDAFVARYPTSSHRAHLADLLSKR